MQAKFLFSLISGAAHSNIVLCIMCLLPTSSCGPSDYNSVSAENDGLEANPQSPPLYMEDLNMPLMQSTLKDSESLRCQVGALTSDVPQ